MYNYRMKKVRVGVVRGGSNKSDYQKSISTGSILLRALREHDDYEPVDILIDQEESWHLDGTPLIPHQLVYKVDLCIVTIEKPLKGGYVENNIRALGIKCFHNPPAALRGYIPDSLKKVIESIGVRIPNRLELSEFDDKTLRTLHNTFSPPYTINFVNSFGEVNHIFHTSNFDDVIDVFNHHEKPEQGIYVIEEYTPGDEWAVTVVPDFRDVKYYTLSPVYLGSLNPAFRSNIPKNLSSESGFASATVRQSLDLYAKLAAAVLPNNVPTTFVFRHLLDKKPVLTRAIERYYLNDDEMLTSALRESAIPESEFLNLIIRRGE